MEGRMRFTRRLFAILWALVLLSTGAFSACADDKKLPVEDEGVIAVDDLFNTEDQEEELTIVVSDEEQEERKEEEQPDESADSISSGNENSPKTSNPAVESELSEGENQPEKSNDLLAEDDEIKTDQEEENEQQEEKGQENDPTDGQEETAAAEIKEKPEEFVTTEVTLSPLKRGDLTEDKQEKKEEPQTEESLLRNTKGTVGYTVAVWIEDNPTVKSGSYCIFAYVGEKEYKHTITGSAETALSIPERPKKIYIADPNGRTIDELQALNSEYYLVSEPEFDEENRKYTFNLKKRIECRMQFQSLSDDLQLSGKYYIVAKRKRSGTPVACASIDKGKTDGFGQKNIYNDSTFVIYKIDEFIFDYYKSNPGYYSKYIVEPGQATENGVVFSWSSEPKLVNHSYVYYIYCGKKKEIETEELTEYSNVTVTSKDQDGVTLNEAEFKLYAESACTTEIKTCTGGCFTISTYDTALGNYLPKETGTSNARTLYLKETKVPAGYEIDDGSHPVVITKSIIEQLDEAASKKTITTSYGITVDGKNAIDITNTRLTKEERIDGSITVTAKDKDGVALNGLAFGLYSPQEYGEDTEVATYSEQSFTISTALDALKSYLPTETGEDHATTLYLKQKAAPAGYDADIKVHSIAITKAVSTDLVEVSNVYMYVTTTTYGIVIDDKNAIDITNTKRTKDERAYGEVSVTAKDQDGAALDGLAFGLYPAQECAENTKIATFSKQSYAISTGVDVLTSHLPTEIGSENATILYLKQTTAPAGYDADTAVHSVVITKTVKTDLVEESNTYVTTTAYGITIDGKSSVDIINRKRTGTDRKDGSITIINKDDSGNELSGSSFGLYSDGSSSTAAIAAYTGGRFEIGTNETALTNYLPTDTGTAHARILYLKETEAPTGYDKETAVHTVVITKSIDTYFDNTDNEYITRTTYGITVDGGSTINITNTKRTDEKRTDGSVTVTAKDQDGAALDGLTFGLYPAQECAENTKIATFSKQSFAISTGVDVLTSHLPTEIGSENATTLYLKQTAATPGYDADTVVYPVMITRSETVTLDRDVNAFITMITYVITVDGGDEKVIINRKQNNTNNEENTTNAGTEGNPNSDGNGADASSEGDGNKTNDGENEDQTTGENGKPTTDEENGNSAASAGTQDNTTGGKDGNDSGIKTNQTRKESEKTQTNTGTASISSGETAKTNPAVQTVETDKRNKTDKSPSLTGTEAWRRKTNPGKTKAAAGKRENVIADSVENGWLVSVLQEAIRILAKAVDLLSTIIRTSFPAFLK